MKFAAAPQEWERGTCCRRRSFYYVWSAASDMALATGAGNALVINS